MCVCKRMYWSFIFYIALIHCTFEPLTKECVDLDMINHCCMCTDELHNNSDRLIEITPYTAPLPSHSENIGTSMCVYNNRVVVDNYPDVMDDQQLDTVTLVHVMEYNEMREEWVHDAILDTPIGEGHTLGCSKNYIIIGNTSAENTDVHLFVRTDNPKWSLSVI